MRIYLGCPQQALVEGALADLGNTNPLLVVPKMPAQFGAHRPYEWRTFLTEICLLPSQSAPEEKLVYAMGRVAERTLDARSYFRKVRAMPRFHQQLVQQFLRWGLDALTPELLRQGAQATLVRFDAESEDLRDEWYRKTNELAQLWHAWRVELQQLGLEDPVQQYWSALESLQSVEQFSLETVLLVGFSEFTAFEMEILKLLDTRTNLALALLYDPANPDLFAPTRRLMERIERHFPDAETVFISPPEASRNFAPPKITIFSTPNPLTEVESVAREILQLHHAGIDFSEIRVILRQPASLIEYIETLFTRYGIPYEAEVRLPLLRSRRVQAILNGLYLLAGARTGLDWIAWLHHPAFNLSPNTLQQCRRVRPLNAPSDRWLLQALRQAGSVPPEAHDLLTQFASLQNRFRENFLEVVEQLGRIFLSYQLRSADIEKLYALASAHRETLQTMPRREAIEWLERLCTGADYVCQFGTGEGVRILPLEQADLLGGAVVFVMQALEGVLPRRHPDDPFLREEERASLREVLMPVEPRLNLPTRSEYQAGEPMLFYRACSSARQHLYLTYPRAQNESEALPSFYLKQFSQAETRFFSIEAFAPENPLHPYDLLLKEGTPYAEPTTHLRRNAHRQRVANVDRIFSVTELETLARCPFQHLFRHILKVRPPKNGLQLSDIGSAMHTTLYRALRGRRTLPDDPQAWAEQMQALLQELLQEDPYDLTYWQLQVLEAYATRLLRLFAWREHHYRQQFEMRPVKLEWAFGGIPIDAEDEREALERPEPNYEPPLIYRLATGEQIRICGVIDRIDWHETDRVVMVLDYKLGAIPSKGDLLEARSLQGLLYTNLFRRARGVAHVVLAYDNLTTGKRVRFVPFERAMIERFRQGTWESAQSDCVVFMYAREWREAFEHLRTELARLIEMLKSVRVEPIPGTHCRLCAYADLCRKAQR